MRQKIGPTELKRDQWSYAKANNVRRYFGPMIDFLLANRPALEGDANGQKLCYIANDTMESELRSVLKHDQSQFWQLVGYKGMGKSSAIRGTFDLWEGSGVSKFLSNSLIIYCSFNSVDLPSDGTSKSVQSAVRQVIEGVLGAALHTLREEHKKRNGIAVDNKEFIDFLKTTRKDILYRYPVDDDDSLDSGEGSLTAWKKSDRMTYRATRLKFEMSRLPADSTAEDRASKPELKRQILIVLDDIEGLVEIEARKALTGLFAPLWNCFQNGVSFPSKILVAHRPHTRDEFTRNQIWTPNTIDFSTRLSLTKLLSHKAEVWLGNGDDGKVLRTRDSWEESYAALMSLLTRYGSQASQEVLLSLSNHCFRDSLTRLLNCMQTMRNDRANLNPGPSGSFKLPIAWPHLTRSELIEIIGRRGYDNFSPDEKEGVANIFENISDDESGDFLIPIALHWAVHQTSKYSNDWPKLIDFKSLHKYLKAALPDSDQLIRLPWAVKRCTMLGLVDDVLDQFDQNIILYHVMPRAKVLYGEIADNSVLLEFFCMDFFLDEPHLSNQRAESRGTFFQAIRFCALAVDFERKLLAAAVHKSVLWEKVFHRHLISRHMYSGLIGTWARWAGSKPVDGQRELNILEQKINKLEYDYAH